MSGDCRSSDWSLVSVGAQISSYRALGRDMNEAMILGCLGGVEAAMRVQGIAHGHGVEAAVASLAAEPFAH